MSYGVIAILISINMLATTISQIADKGANCISYIMGLIVGFIVTI